MRVARDLGAFDTLLPSGISTLADMPHPLFTAIRHALVFLSFDELPDDERPPRRIWDSAKKLDSWFKEIRRKRQRSFTEKPIEGDVVENEAAKMLIVGDD